MVQLEIAFASARSLTVPDSMISTAKAMSRCSLEYSDALARYVSAKSRGWESRCSLVVFSDTVLTFLGRHESTWPAALAGLTAGNFGTSASPSHTFIVSGRGVGRDGLPPMTPPLDHSLSFAQEAPRRPGNQPETNNGGWLGQSGHRLCVADPPPRRAVPVAMPRNAKGWGFDAAQTQAEFAGSPASESLG